MVRLGKTEPTFIISYPRDHGLVRRLSSSDDEVKLLRDHFAFVEAEPRAQSGYVFYSAIHGLRAIARNGQTA